MVLRGPSAAIRIRKGDSVFPVCAPRDHVVVPDAADRSLQEILSPCAGGLLRHLPVKDPPVDHYGFGGSGIECGDCCPGQI